MQPYQDEQETHTVLARNITFSLFANILYLISRLFIPPIILHYISLEEYGIWSYCFIIISYVGMSAFGISNVYIRYAAVYNAKGETEKINALISTGILTIGAICLAAMPIVWYSLPWIVKTFNTPEHLTSTAVTLIFGTLLIFLCDLTLNVFSCILQSLQKFVVEKSIWILGYTVETVAIFLLLFYGYGIYALLYAYILRILITEIGYIYFSYRALPKLSLGLSHFDPKVLNLFFHFGGIVQLSSIVAVINRSIEKLCAGFFIGPQATALFDLGEKMPSTASNIPVAISGVILPTSAHMHEKERHDELKQLYVNGSRWISIMTGMMMGFLASFALPLIISWLGTDPKYHIAALILTLFTLPIHLYVITGPGSMIYRGINKPERELYYSLLWLVLMVIGLSCGIYFFGYDIKVILVAVTSMMTLSMLIYLYLNNRFMQVSQRAFCSKVLVPGLLPYLVGYALFLLMHPVFVPLITDRWMTLKLFLLGFALYNLCIIPMVYLLMFSSDERNYLLRLIFGRKKTSNSH